MESFNESMIEYKRQMQKGIIHKAYKELMDYIMQLRTYFMNKHPEYSAPGNIYYGYMDMTYFPIFPKLLQDRKLKIALVFIHDTCSFEVWLSGYNKQVQSKYWELIKKNNWNKYHIVANPKDHDSIIEYVIAGNPEFHDLDKLTKKLEGSTLTFIKDVETFLSKHKK